MEKGKHHSCFQKRQKGRPGEGHGADPEYPEQIQCLTGLVALGEGVTALLSKGRAAGII